MSRAAKVISIEALQTTIAALQRFRSEAAAALDEMELETRRGLNWIHHDRKDYWTHEMRRAEEAVAQARVQLIQAKTTRRVADREPECYDEKKALARAQRRYDTALRKIEAVRRWARSIDHAAAVYQRSRRQFLAWLDGELLQAVAALHRMSASLESFTSLEAPSAAPPPMPGEQNPSVGDGGEPSSLLAT